MVRPREERLTGTLPEDLERSAILVEDRPVAEVAPAKEPLGPGEWVRQNLFSSWFNGALTVVAAVAGGWLLFQITRWFFFRAEWAVVKANLRVYMVGGFPLDQIWRVWTSLYLVVALAGLSVGVVAPRVRTLRGILVRVALAAVGALLLMYLLDGVGIWVLIGVAVAVFAAGVAAGRLLGRRLRVPLVVGWTLAFPAVVLIIRAFGGVPPSRWAGFMLNLIVAVVAIFVSFPVGVLLALGRRSTLRAVRVFCVGFIELIRGVPLVTLLIFSILVLPLLLPPGITVPRIMLAMTMFVVFSSAYVGEIVRGGLQGIPDGQYEAGRALGLPTWRMMGLVILPQALRHTIPAMIGHFISLFKDTTLLAALTGFSELLATARRATAVQFIGAEQEALLSAALIFWGIAYAMARWSQRVERRLGVGER
ncbi:MAG TPA: amino acid ABC transporter permease [Actinomycetota bacterium]|nr:amino acid ABC transporter permease [Actinomycetota bacterium]